MSHYIIIHVHVIVYPQWPLLVSSSSMSPIALPSVRSHSSISFCVSVASGYTVFSSSVTISNPNVLNFEFYEKRE